MCHSLFHQYGRICRYGHFISSENLIVFEEWKCFYVCMQHAEQNRIRIYDQHGMRNINVWILKRGKLKIRKKEYSMWWAKWKGKCHHCLKNINPQSSERFFIIRKWYTHGAKLTRILITIIKIIMVFLVFTRKKKIMWNPRPQAFKVHFEEKIYQTFTCTVTLTEIYEILF